MPVVSGLDAEAAEWQARARRFIEEELYPVERRVAERGAIDAEEVRELRARAREAGFSHYNLPRKLGCADRVHFTGELSPKGVATFLRALDVFVFPSAGETFGLAVVEAAQAGVPVVANRLAVLQEVLSIDGQPCALFVDAADTAAFAAAVRRLFEEPALAAGLSARGCQLDRRYSLDAMVEAYVCLIEAQARHSAPLVSVPVRTLPSGTG